MRSPRRTSRGVLHRDIKPSNILVQDDGHTKITDFGIAKSFDARGRVHDMSDDMTMTGVVLGTPGYLAPERRSGRPATVQSDLYSVGAVMLEAATGHPMATDGVEPGVLVDPFRTVAYRALAADPDERFTCAEAMLGALRTQPARPRRSPSRPTRARGRWRRWPPVPSLLRPHRLPPRQRCQPAPRSRPPGARHRPARHLAHVARGWVGGVRSSSWRSR